MLDLSFYKPYEDEKGYWVLESDLDEFAQKLFNKKTHDKSTDKVWQKFFECKIVGGPFEFGATNRYRVRLNV